MQLLECEYLKRTRAYLRVPLEYDRRDLPRIRRLYRVRAGFAYLFSPNWYPTEASKHSKEPLNLGHVSSREVAVG